MLKLNKNRRSSGHYTLRGIVLQLKYYIFFKKVMDEAKKDEESAISEVDNTALVNRLKRLEGQIRGIQKMLDDDRDCVSVIMQLAAIRSGIEGIGALALNNCMRHCLYDDSSTTSDVNALTKALQIWGRVRTADIPPEPTGKPIKRHEKDSL